MLHIHSITQPYGNTVKPHTMLDYIDYEEVIFNFQQAVKPYYLGEEL